MSLPDWLPAGWNVEVRGRTNGKKHKWFSDPSKGLKFSSKADVLRYLSSVGSNSSKSSSTKHMKKNATAKFSTEKAASDGLPPGWIKEMRVRKRGNKTRKYPYYVDPVSGQTFRSIKEVSRFLETREIERFESKVGDQCPSTSELVESFSSLPAEADKQISMESDAFEKEINLNQKPKLGAEHSSCVEGSVTLSEGLRGGVVASDDGKVASEKQHDKERVVLKRKKGVKLGRRRSKRLAAIDTQEEEEETQAATINSNKEESKKSESCLSDIWRDPCIEFAIKTLTGTLPVNEKIANEIPGPCPNMPCDNTPCDEIWSDPCFMFAVKTLRGEIEI